MEDFPGSPVVKNLPASSGDTGLNPGSGRSPHAARQLAPQAATAESVRSRAQAPQLEFVGCNKRPCMTQPRPNTTKQTNDFFLKGIYKREGKIHLVTGWVGSLFMGDVYTLSLYIYGYVQIPLGFPGGSIVKNLPAIAGNTLGWEDPLEKEMSWEIPWTEEPGRLSSMGSQN